ncbi:MAG: EF-P lysine aminoacylase GenX [Deltaproteobacteria bacterium]|nr:EF-P lysine aminoacylase GenX [Deltaproteobacteria bacterium]
MARPPVEAWPQPAGSAGADLGRFVGERLGRLARRAALLARTRVWFLSRGFMEVETPLLVPSPGTEVHLDPVAATLTPGPGLAAERRWLITSPEYAMKRLLAAGAGPIYQIARVFRDGERGARHRPEFTMVEWYRPWVEGYDALIADCEAWLSALADESGQGPVITWQGRRFDLTPPWPRITFFDLLRTRAGVARPEELDEAGWIEALVAVERGLGDGRPEVVVDWPVPLASLSRRSERDPRVAERFEVYLGGLELGNAFAELTDAAEQRARCVEDNRVRAATGKPELPLDEDFLGALAAGMPPSAGIAVGFDRLAMIFCDAPTIDDVVAF